MVGRHQRGESEVVSTIAVTRTIPVVDPMQPSLLLRETGAVRKLVDSRSPSHEPSASPAPNDPYGARYGPPKAIPA